MKKKGFTLIELLAVIVILAIVLAIAIPSISGIISSATRGALESDAKMVLQQLEYENLNNDTFDVTTVTESTITNFNLSNDNYENLRVGLVNGKPYIIIVGKNKWADLKACGTIKNITIVPSSDTTTCEDISEGTPVLSIPSYSGTKGVNPPALITGMTPIKWNGTEWVTTTASDSDWYNYTEGDKKWANARTNDCTTPGDIETCSMWVWIPRYAYQISTCYHLNKDQCVAATGKEAGTINIKFLKNATNTASDNTTVDLSPTYSGSTQTNYIQHPAFTFGDDQLTGIWVAKFEPTAAEGVDNGYYSDFTCPNAGDNVNTKTIKIIPNAQSWRCITTGNAFTVSRNMETNNVYGWGTSGNGIDTHMMKNTEWGSVVYLSQSTYGKNAKVWINPNSDYMTGCAGDNVSAVATTLCNTYDTPNGQQASTTGNATGIYDMYGSAWEITVSNYENNQASEGLDPATVEDKYINRYSGANRGYNNTIFGDAVYETSQGVTWNGTSWEGDTYGSWYEGSTYMPFANSPWFMRGGRIVLNSIFTFSYGESTPAGSRTFRPAILIGSGL